MLSKCMLERTHSEFAIATQRYCCRSIGVRFASELLKLKVFGLGMLTSWPHTLAHILSITEFCIWNTDSLLWVHDVCVFFSVLISIAAFDFRAFVFVLSVSVSLSFAPSVSHSLFSFSRLKWNIWQFFWNIRRISSTNKSNHRCE